MKSEASPLVDPLVEGKAMEGSASGNAATPGTVETHTTLLQKDCDIGLDKFVHAPALFTSAVRSARIQRSEQARRYIPNDNTVWGAIEAVLYGSIRSATVFSSVRILTMIIGHLTASLVLCIIYSNVYIGSVSEAADFVSGIKDYVDLCVTGIVRRGGRTTLA